MKEITLTQYVDAACALHGLALDAEARERVLETFKRTAQLAAPLLEFELPADMEPAHTFKA